MDFQIDSFQIRLPMSNRLQEVVEKQMTFPLLVFFALKVIFTHVKI